MAAPARRRGRDSRRADLGARARRAARRWALCRVGRRGGHRRAAGQRQPDRARARVRARRGLLATRGRAGWAGAAAAGAAFFRPDVGVLAAIAAAVTLCGSRDTERAPVRRGTPRASGRRRRDGGGRGARARASLVRARAAARAPRAHSRACSSPRSRAWRSTCRSWSRPGRARCGTRSWSRPSRDGVLVAAAVPARLRRRRREGLRDVAGAVCRARHARARGAPVPACRRPARPGPRRGRLLPLARRPRACAGAAGRHGGACGADPPEARRRGRAGAADRRRHRRTAPRRCSSRPTSRRWRGVRVPPADARDIPRVDARVQRLVPPGRADLRRAAARRTS